MMQIEGKNSQAYTSHIVNLNPNKGKVWSTFNLLLLMIFNFYTYNNIRLFVAPVKVYLSY